VDVDATEREVTSDAGPGRAATDDEHVCVDRHIP
jgi:hypothetical protein